MTEAAHVTGLILAGGQARRMQELAGSGSASSGTGVIDKGLLVLRGETLVAHAERFLRPFVNRIFISANRNLDQYAPYGDVIVDEEPLAGLGPLSGVASALPVIKTEWLLVMPVDVCNIPADFAPALMRGVSASPSGVGYAVTVRSHPLCMMVHKGQANSLRESLMAGERRVQSWQSEAGAVQVAFDRDPQLFFNINTPQDLLVAQALPYASHCAKS